MEIDTILNVLKVAFPQFKHEDIENDQILEKITQANFLSFNIHFEKGDENTPTVYITQHKNIVEAAFKPTSIMLMHDREHDHKLIIRQAPFSCKTNIIIDNPSLWESTKEIKIRQLKIIPAILDEIICIETMKIPTPRTFKVNIKNDNQLNVNIWAFDEETEIDISDSSIPQSIFRKNCDWTFQKYLPDEIIRFESMQEIVISFDENIVKGSILIKRQHHIRPDEYYVLVVSH